MAEQNVLYCKIRSLGKEECEMKWFFADRSEDVDDMIFPDDTWTRSER